MRRLAQCRRMTAPDRRIAAFVWTCLLLATLAGLSLWAILAGPFPLSLSDLPTLSPAQHSVLFNLRLPRLVAAIGIGGGLAISGCSFQAVLRNPLADPSFIGVSGGAAVAAAACLAVLHQLSFIPLPPQVLIAVAALTGGLASAALVMRISRE